MWSWIFGNIFLGLVYVAFSEVQDCPSSDKVFPCYCKNDYFLTYIECKGAHSTANIQHVLENTKGLNLSYSFWESRLGDIPPDFFEGQHSSDVYFENCRIGSFGNRPFTGLEDKLVRLYIYGSVDKRKQDLETFPLGHLKKLEYFAFQANYIKRLGNEWFEGGPASLQQLMLEGNYIEELGDRAFASLANLEQIWMGDNRFKKVARSMFPQPANKLSLLEMSEIEELPDDIFEDMPALKSISVSGNKLKSLPQTTWGKIWDQLDEVYLEHPSRYKNNLYRFKS